MEDSRIFDDSATDKESVVKKDEFVESLERVLDRKLSKSQARTLSLVGSLLSDNKIYVNIMNDISDVLKIIRKWRL